MKYKKKPVEIEAVIFTREMAEGSVSIPDGVRFCSRTLHEGKFFDFADKYPLENFETCHRHVIDTLEGVMNVQIGDYIIKGVKGEFYPCKPDIFELTYDAV